MGPIARQAVRIVVVVVAVLVGGGLLAWALTRDDAARAPGDVPAPTMSAGEVAEPGGDTAPVETPGPPEGPGSPDPAVLPGWVSAEVAPDVFGGVAVTGAVAWEGSIVAVGCDHELTTSGERGDGPIWVGAGSRWERVGPVSVPGSTGTDVPVTCIDQVVATPHGLFAAAGSALIRSADGLTWEPVEVAPDAWVDAILAVSG